MHRPKSHIVALAAAAVLAALPGLAGAITVRIDENTVLDLRAPAGNVLIGNPSVVDVTLLNPRRIAILGKTYGVTNLIITDRMGRTIFQQEVNVANAGPGRVSVYKAGQVQNFACSPTCQRTPMPGEDKTAAYDPASGSFKDYADRIQSASGGTPAQ